MAKVLFQTKAPVDLGASRWGRMLLRVFRGRPVPADLVAEFEKCSQINDYKALLHRARKSAAGIRADKLKSKGLLGKWAESVLAKGH
jgi:hypothetical protein